MNSLPTSFNLYESIDDLTLVELHLARNFNIDISQREDITIHDFRKISDLALDILKKDNQKTQDDNLDINNI